MATTIEKLKAGKIAGYAVQTSTEALLEVEARLAAAEQVILALETRVTKLEASLTTLTKKIGNI